MHAIDQAVVYPIIRQQAGSYNLPEPASGYRLQAGSYTA